MTYRSIEYIEQSNTLRLLDQKRLPAVTAYLELGNEQEIAAAIRDMTVRGAPAIGVAAAFGIVSAGVAAVAEGGAALHERLLSADRLLRASRPTAVNLFWALDRMRAAVDEAAAPADTVSRLLAEARAIEAEDVDINLAISRHAMTLVPDNAVIFHHCNTGSLATVRHGTALGIIVMAHEQGRLRLAYLDETRPRLQGAKLSAWELLQHGAPHAVVVDGASAHIMRTQQVDLCVVGCDRVAANGDTANKIGTYNLALAAQDNDVPFYVAAPTTTIDLQTPDGDAIAIETRADEELTHIDGQQITPDGAGVFNPAFDVTPHRLIAAIITERGIARPPYRESLAALLRKPDAERKRA